MNWDARFLFFDGGSWRQTWTYTKSEIRLRHVYILKPLRSFSSSYKIYTIFTFYLTSVSRLTPQNFCINIQKTVTRKVSHFKSKVEKTHTWPKLLRKKYLQNVIFTTTHSVQYFLLYFSRRENLVGVTPSSR